MFKSIWRRKYEKAMRNAETWRDYHKRAAETYLGSSNEDLRRMHHWHSAQLQAWEDMLSDMKQIAKGP